MSEIVIFQVDPGVKEFALYQLTLDDGTDLGQVLVARTAHENYAAETEYWSLTQVGMDTIHRANSITWDGAAYDWSELPNTSWHSHHKVFVFFSRFNNTNRNRSVRTQPIGQNTSRASCTDNYIIIFSHMPVPALFWTLFVTKLATFSL